MASIGIVALQGEVRAHAQAVSRLGHTPVLVRRPADLEGRAGIILPGGESSVHIKLLEESGLWDALTVWVGAGKRVLGTCAGLILAARIVSHPHQRSFGWLDVAVERNGWGRQRDSFEATADDGVTPLVFIRAPRIRQVGARSLVLLTYRGEPVLVRQGDFFGCSFHPELTPSQNVMSQVFPATRREVFD